MWCVCACLIHLGLSSRKGKPPPIKLTVVQRAGNKKVPIRRSLGHMIVTCSPYLSLQATLVDNLEIYGIDPDKFASNLQKMAATSASGHKRLHILTLILCACMYACVDAFDTDV